MPGLNADPAGRQGDDVGTGPTPVKPDTAAGR
jgi:hypothetical protein